MSVSKRKLLKELDKHCSECGDDLTLWNRFEESNECIDCHKAQHRPQPVIEKVFYQHIESLIFKAPCTGHEYKVDIINKGSNLTIKGRGHKDDAWGSSIINCKIDDIACNIRKENDCLDEIISILNMAKCHILNKTLNNKT